MTKIDVVSGFLGAGKTTLIKKLLKEALADQQVVLIENEFGEIGIDGGFLKDAGIEIKEMNSGCICCSLVGDFGTSLKEVLSKYKPDRILIEPSGVGKLSDIVKAIKSADLGDDVVLNSAVVVIDASKTKMYVKNFGEFYVNQVEHAGTIILSRTDKMSDEKLKEAVNILREHNQTATIVTTPWNDIDGKAIEETIEGRLLSTKNVKTEVEITGHDVKVRYTGDFLVPGGVNLVPEAGFKELKIKAEGHCSRRNPVSFVRECRTVINAAEDLGKRRGRR